VSGVWSDFVETEVLPKVAKDYNITFTTDPDGRGTMGGSSGAAAAFSMAWWHPERYHRVLMFSSSLTRLATNDVAPEGAWDYHAHLIPESDPKPIRVWVTASEQDNSYTSSEASLRNWVIANQHMAAALKAKGYHYQYVFALNAHHTDGNVEREMLPDAMVWLWQGYPINGATAPSKAVP
jgi:iron(III)-enterobactin esterase